MTYYPSKGRRRIDWSRLAAVILVLAFIALVGFIGYRLITKERIPTVLKSSNSRCESIVEVDDRYIIAAYYPSDISTGAGKQIRNDIQALIDEYKAENEEYVVEDKNSRLVMQVDYQEVRDNDYVSYQFYSKTGTSIYLLEDKDHFSYVYSNSDRKIIGVDDLFEGDYLKQLSARVRLALTNSSYKDRRDLSIFYQNTDAEIENFENFIIVGDYIRFYFDAKDLLKSGDGSVMADVNLRDLSYYFKKDLKLDNTIAKSTVKNDARYIDVNKPMIALTYDDGPYGPVDEVILNALEEVGGACTFFVVGERVDWSMNAGYLERAVEMGCEVGCHTYNHVNLTKLSAEEIKKEIDDTIVEINKLLPSYKVTTVRPVGGSYDDNVKSSVEYVMFNWSLDSLDWKTRDKDEIYKKVMDYLEDGDIILMHDLYTATGEATEMLIDELKDTYQFVTVSEIMDYKGVEAKAGDVILSPNLRIH